MSDVTGGILLRDVRKPHRTRWGPWVFRQRTLTLEYRDAHGRWVYEVDLEECVNSAATLDWIFQVVGKPWCSLSDLGHLLRALDHLLDPQAKLCSFGVDRPLSAEQLRVLLLERGE